MRNDGFDVGNRNAVRGNKSGLWVNITGSVFRQAVLITLAVAVAAVNAAAEQDLQWPPQLPGGETMVSDTSPEFITVPDGVELRPDTQVAQEAPTIDFMYFPGQTYEGNPWSIWGDALGVGEHLYYTAIGDHIGPDGTAQLYEYNAETQELRMLADIKNFLEDEEILSDDMRYSPGKVHSRIDMGRDGWLYYSTHRGSTAAGTDDEHGYKGDWIFRTNPDTEETEIVAHHPVEKHVIPASVTDPERLIFYGGTSHGRDADLRGVQFFAWDIEEGRKLIREPEGFNRYAILAQSTGKVYWKHRGDDTGRVYDPETNSISEIDLRYVRAATRETDDKKVYAISQGDGIIWSFCTETEQYEELGYGLSGDRDYVTAMEVDPATGRYVYYIGGAHGRIADEGTPIMQWDTETNTRKVIAFVGPYYEENYGYTPDGTFGIGISSDGARLYVTWNGMRTGSPGAGNWDTCALMVVNIPETERRP